jgi:threonine dehydratase
LRRSAWLSEAARGEVWLKLETVQPTFSFKLRGAFNAILRLAGQRGTLPSLVTASAGNHGRAMAFAAAEAGLPLTVYAPEHAPETKLKAITALGADLRLCDDYDQAELRAKEHAARGDALFISPYSHPDVIAGAGTVGLEIAEDLPDVGCVVVPIGGGGLISGMAVALHDAAPQVWVHGVEVEASCPFTRSLAAGRIVEIDVKPTLADGLAGNLDRDTVTFDIVRRLVRTVTTIEEEELRDAVALLARHERLIVEGAGAVATAALCAGKLDLDGRKTAVVVSGANIDLDLFRSLI